MPQPQRFGRYTLIERLGVGGMAEVFRARIVKPGGVELEVCLKRILSHYSADPEFVQMFIDEARVASKLQHANIVQVQDFDQVEGDYYIAMELVEGKDLHGLLVELHRRGESLGEARAVQIAIGLARGLAYAHGREDQGLPLQIVHRDVSPHNVLLSYAGDVKLSDFGIARAVSRLTQTATGMVKGKVAYMAPEQALAQPIDARIDQFAAGLVLYEMLCGDRAYTGDSQNEIIQRASRAQVPALPDTVHPSLREIVKRATALAPQDRYPDMAAMEQQLVQVLFELKPSPDQLDVGAPLRRLFAPAADRPGTEVLPAVESLPPYQEPPLDPTSSARPRAKQQSRSVEDARPATTLKADRGVLPSAADATAAPPRTPRLQRALLATAALAIGLGGVWGAGFFAAPPPEVVAALPRPGPDASPRSAAPVAVSAGHGGPMPDASALPDTPRLEAGDGGSADVQASDSGRKQVARAGKGRVVIRVRDAWAEVWVAGRKRGVTPLELSLPAGRRSIELVNPEIPVRRKLPVRVRAGQDTLVEVSLRAAD